MEIKLHRKHFDLPSKNLFMCLYNQQWYRYVNHTYTYRREKSQPFENYDISSEQTTGLKTTTP